MNNITILQGDCLEILRGMADASVDAVVTDPPYGLSFMGKKWDYDVPSEDIWRECLRVLKHGGHLLAFAGTRTQHRMAVRIEDAGFEIRDMIAWVYGSGFPKSMNVSKAIAKRAGGDIAARDAISFMRDRREELGLSRPDFERLIFGRSDGNVRNWEDGISLPKPGLWADIKRAMGLEATPFDAAMERGDEVIGSEHGSFGYQKDGARWDEARVIRSPATDAARQWQGWDTALKPAMEPITVARKPLIGTVAENVLTHGTGAINVDGCRVGTETITTNAKRHGDSVAGNAPADSTGSHKWNGCEASTHASRWPANLIHDGSNEPTDLLGDAARFFYCAKASKADRDEGCEGLKEREAASTSNGGKAGKAGKAMTVGAASLKGEPTAPPKSRNHHPTVKPTALMRYLCRLVTPPSGIVLDPFMGSGSTGKAAILEGFNFVGIEREAEYVEIAKARIASVTQDSPPTPEQQELSLAV